jgi:carboxypeptidase C (cathepsin A)
MNRATTWLASGLLTISTLLGALAAQEPRPQGGTGQPDSQAKDKDKAGEPAKAKDQEKKEAARGKSATDEEPVITHHGIKFGGEELKYTATAGLMPIKDAKGENEARIFFMAYTGYRPDCCKRYLV